MGCFVTSVKSGREKTGLNCRLYPHESERREGTLGTARCNVCPQHFDTRANTLGNTRIGCLNTVFFRCLWHSTYGVKPGLNVRVNRLTKEARHCPYVPLRFDMESDVPLRRRCCFSQFGQYPIAWVLWSQEVTTTI